ncbi:MAG: DoxX family membrane protein [Janthinobacterium lividum]
MNLLSKIQDWGDHHHPQWVDYFRLALGLTLVWKGFAFALNLNAFTALMTKVEISTAVSISFTAHIIILLHIIGGLCIALGTHTRLFCLLNLPVLIVAVFFVNLPENIFSPYSEFWFSCLVLFALNCFLIEGNGAWSVEHKKEIVS